MAGPVVKAEFIFMAVCAKKVRNSPAKNLSPGTRVRKGQEKPAQSSREYLGSVKKKEI